MTYRTTVTRRFVAQHFLTVPDPGAEGDLHSHVFSVEATFAGPSLNEYDYLVDIDDVRAALDGVEDRYRDATLNDLPEFEGYNPSVERFARVVHERLAPAAAGDPAETLRVTVWEDDEAAAGYEGPIEEPVGATRGDG
ncbi:6-pyruvoyl trahydropterin synthase family protein [Halobaculum magnesiiphilum]|uniref:6-carboxytetrahydropterin synthase n=1 Tax=Halobaculum magnesiiphilum TaxID=1017351 RepID=A0A8T8W9I3_9EURY|nr:6-carboxytetrahydropterin synthase [Halobaculum magnesiiphilum]QZP36497.1 6-carboxytetrahydropterin synthase [Halobaculum magnesiiphilum]